MTLPKTTQAEPESIPAACVSPSSKSSPRVISYPVEPHLSEAISRIDPEAEYSAKQAVRLTDMKRFFFENREIFPEGTFRSVDNNYGSQTFLYQGRAIIAFLKAQDQIPVDLRPLASARKAMGMSAVTVWHRLSTIDGQRYLSHTNSRGENELIPLYRTGNVLYLDARTLEYIQRDATQKTIRMNWSEVAAYLREQGIDVEDAMLVASGTWLVRHLGKEKIKYPLLSGQFFEMEATKPKRIVKNFARSTERTFDRTDVTRFAKLLVDEQKKYMRLADFRRRLSESGLGTTARDNLPFTLDGKRYEMTHVNRGQNAYVLNEDAERYLVWRTIRSSKDYCYVAKAYHGMTTSQRRKRKLAFESTKTTIEGEKVCLLSGKYGIAIRRLQAGTCEKIHLANLGLARFYVNLKSSPERHVSASVNELRAEIERDMISGAISIRTLARLWILKDHYMDLCEKDPAAKKIDEFSQGNSPPVAWAMQQMGTMQPNEAAGYEEAVKTGLRFF